MYPYVCTLHTRMYFIVKQACMIVCVGLSYAHSLSERSHRHRHKDKQHNNMAIIEVELAG